MVDSRGFSEHLLYSKDDDDLYRKILAVANIRTALSVSTLKQAMKHGDERIRLTAYKTLDKKVSDLNREIQSLEKLVNTGDTTESSNTWLQIASNYWELLTIERGEPVARKQLLKKASEAAIQAVSVLPINRNAHFILGRVSLMQGDTRRAKIALERSMALGMPGDKVLPQLAEAAFMQHDYPKVKELLNRLDPATRAYPPLSHVAEYWA
jgi:tetratricopeptide (TPR) repeat protein